jgi:methionine-gamma-lyase
LIPDTFCPQQPEADPPRDRLGGTESPAEHLGTMTHSDIPPGRQGELGITPAMLRLSVGVEHPEDLIADLAQALEAV